MVEVIFNESAWASLKMAPCCVSGDVCGLPLGLSMGRITETSFFREREALLARLYGIFPNGQKTAKEQLQSAAQSLAHILRYAERGETIRIWYSNQPDEQCGLCWLMEKLAALKTSGKLLLVKLPDWESDVRGTLIQRNSWGEVEPNQWAGYLPLAQEAPPAFPAALAMRWQALRQEKMPLRAVVNGRLQSVPEDFYDVFILREIAAQPVEFQQAVVIGRVLGQYQLGISDAWIALRMEHMLDRGILTAITSPPKDGPVYYRILRKTQSP